MHSTPSHNFIVINFYVCVLCHRTRASLARGGSSLKHSVTTSAPRTVTLCWVYHTTSRKRCVDVDLLYARWSFSVCMQTYIHVHVALFCNISLVRTLHVGGVCVFTMLPRRKFSALCAGFIISCLFFTFSRTSLISLSAQRTTSSTLCWPVQWKRSVLCAFCGSVVITWLSCEHHVIHPSYRVSAALTMVPAPLVILSSSSVLFKPPPSSGVRSTWRQVTAPQRSRSKPVPYSPTVSYSVLPSIVEDGQVPTHHSAYLITTTRF